jgi:hypothetical protein
MVSNEDYIILMEVLRKIEHDSNYKMSYTEETTISTLQELKNKNEFDDAEFKIRFDRFNCM